MKTINRKVAVALAFAILTLSSILSGAYYYKSVHNYLKRLEEKLILVTNTYNQMKVLEKESEIIAMMKDEINNSLKVNVTGILNTEELENIVRKIITSEVAEIDYFSIKSESQFPILFDDVPINYQVSIMIGGNINGNQ
ncbi:MAG TPA: hypothetical protein PKI14_04180 [Fervidobacterium sp.]|nr:hypothetical protein [Fervidobacterium sp.]HPZ17213.1 hypothetical protein [Fervidobacterium sp.]HQE48308.1 hypothetical protein [Fervidobacterium sp.]HUM42126.1 hypothetical protein [Fervidobacterium sp.]